MTFIPSSGVQILRGDERVHKTHIGPVGWFCVGHGYERIVRVLDAGEVYPACPWCLLNSPHITLSYAETLSAETLAEEKP